MMLVYMQFNTSRGVSIPRCQTKYAVPQSTQNITIYDHIPKLKQEICHPSTTTEIPPLGKSGAILDGRIIRAQSPRYDLTEPASLTAHHRPARKRPNKSPGHRAAPTRTGTERFRPPPTPGGVRVPAGRCCSSMCCRSSRGRSSARPRGTARPAPSPAWSSPRPSPPPPSSHCPPATPRLARREGLSLSWLGRCGGTGIVLAQ